MIGREYEVLVRRGKIGPNLFRWVHGNAYNYGIGEPNYPVPALANAAMCLALNWTEEADSKFAFDGDYCVVPWLEDTIAGGE